MSTDTPTRSRRPSLARAARAYGPSLIQRIFTARRRFVILTAGRSGSELLVDLLNSHPQIVCDGEILGTHRALPERFVAARAVLARLRGAEAYGFKLLREHVALQELGDPASYLRRLHESGVRIILLERRDMVAQAVSFVRAAAGRYHYRRADGVLFTPTRVDPMAVLATMYVLEEGVSFARQALASIPHLRLVYEDHLSDSARHQPTADDICNYLGLAPAPVRTELIRITPRRTADQLENFDEVVAALSATRFAAYL